MIWRLSRLRHSQRLERWLINRLSRVETVVALIVTQSRAGDRSEQAIYLALIITLCLQRGLNICDYLIERQIVISVDRTIIWVVGDSRIVTPRRIPVARTPKIPATVNQNDTIVVIVPPGLIVPCASVVLESGVLLSSPGLTALNAIVRLELRALDPRIWRI